MDKIVLELFETIPKFTNKKYN